MSSTKKHETLRLRVFAGPNGSGKSTIISAVRAYRVSGRSPDFGIYINADDIAAVLRHSHLDFSSYQITTDDVEFQQIASHSGLVGGAFDHTRFTASYSLVQNQLTLTDTRADERMAQIIADFLRKKLLKEGKKFSFETVFSHPGKLDIMRQARDAGYRVYLYFVSTESPDINIDRVENRVSNKGHDVPEDKIRGRYYRSLDLLHDAAQLTYQTFFFDNSRNKPELFAHFQLQKDHSKKWDDISDENLPVWFRKYYLGKVKK